MAAMKRNSASSIKSVVMRVVREAAGYGNAAPIEDIANEVGGDAPLASTRRATRALVRAGRLVDVGGECFELAS